MEMTTALARFAASFRWDTPFRLLASVLGVLAVASLVAATPTPVTALRDAADWVTWTQGASWLSNVQQWLATPARHETLVTGASLLLIGGLLANAPKPKGFLPTDDRGVFTAMIGLAMLVELGDIAPTLPSTIILVLAVAAALRFVPRTDERGRRLPADWSWLQTTIANLLLVPLVAVSPVLWLIGSSGRVGGRGGLQAHDAPEPPPMATGAVQVPPTPRPARA